MNKKKYSESTDRIIKYLIKNKEENITAKEIAASTGLSLPTVNGTLTGLQKNNFIKRITIDTFKSPNLKYGVYIIATPELKKLNPYYISINVRTFEEAISNISEISLELLKENEYLSLSKEQFQSLELLKEMI